MKRQEQPLSAVRLLWQRTAALPLSQWGQVLVGAWLWFAAAVVWIRPGNFALLAFAQEVPLWLAVVVIGSLALPAVLLTAWYPAAKVGARLFVGGAVTLVLSLAARSVVSDKTYLYLSLVAVSAFTVYYAAHRGLLCLPRWRPGQRTVWTAAGVLFVVMAGLIAVLGWARYASYTAPNFDFGIFCQMFHNMKETLLPMTTCERNGWLSHFAVHVSPVYYLLLPVYALFPSPVTLLVGQAVVVASGLFPLYLLAQKYGLSHKVSLMLLVGYAAYPALSTGCLYDLHENCFLTPLLLWLFCAYEYRRPVLTVVAALLVLSVKEDAAVYVLLFAVYLLLDRRDTKRGLWLLSLSVLWFSVAMWYLNTFGEGGMVGRYADYQYGDSGLLGVIKTLAVNPGRFFSTVLYGTAQQPHQKWWYVCQMGLPLAAGLFTGRRYTRYVLVLPIFLNLLSNWPYQYNLGFQYSFGISAFFFYLCVLNLSDRTPAARRGAVTYIALAAIILQMLLFLPEVKNAVVRYRTNEDTFTRLTAVLDTVPEEASVTCSTFLLPHLAQRTVVYEDNYHTATDTQYLVLDLRPGYRGERTEEYRIHWTAAGYTVKTEIPDLVLIMTRD